MLDQRERQVALDQPRFMPGRDYDGAFRGIEFSKGVAWTWFAPSRNIEVRAPVRCSILSLWLQLTRTAGETNVTADGSAKDDRSTRSERRGPSENSG